VAIAFVSSTRQTGSLVTSFTMTIDVGTGTNRLLVVFLFQRGSPTLRDVSAITYNGVALSLAASIDNVDPGSDLRSQIYYLANPSAGSNTLSVTYAAQVGQYECKAAWFTGVAQTSPLDDTDAATGSSNAPACSLTPTANNCLLVGGVIHEAVNALTTGSGENTIDNTDHGAWVTSASYAIQTTAATQSIDWSAPASDYWSAAAAVFKEAASGVTVTPAAVSAVGAVVAPIIVLGSMSVTPNPAGGVAAVVAPTTIQGAITIANKIAAAVSSIVNPTIVLGSPTITPNPAVSVSSVIAPSVIQGAITIANKIASAVCNIANPTVVKGSLSITPNAAGGVSSTLLGGVIQGAITIADKVAAAIGAIINPTVLITGGSTTVTPDPAYAVTSVMGPDVDIPSGRGRLRRILLRYIRRS